MIYGCDKNNFKSLWKINKLNTGLVSQPIAKIKNNHRVVYKCQQRKYH